MHLHPYVVDQLAEQHHQQLIAVAHAERVAGRTARRANRRAPRARMSRRFLLGRRPCPTVR